MTNAKVYGHHTASFEVFSEGYHAFSVHEYYIGIEPADARVARYMVPQTNRVDITFRVGNPTSEHKRLIIWVNPKTSPDKTKWVHLTPISVDGIDHLVPVYASLIED